MTSKRIKSKAFEWATDYKPMETNLPYRSYAEEGFVQGFMASEKNPNWNYCPFCGCGLEQVNKHVKLCNNSYCEK